MLQDVISKWLWHSITITVTVIGVPGLRLVGLEVTIIYQTSIMISCPPSRWPGGAQARGLRARRPASHSVSRSRLRRRRVMALLCRWPCRRAGQRFHLAIQTIVLVWSRSLQVCKSKVALKSNEAKHSNSNCYFNVQLNNHVVASRYWEILGCLALDRGADSDTPQRLGQWFFLNSGKYRKNSGPHWGFFNPSGRLALVGICCITFTLLCVPSVLLNKTMQCL